MNDMGYLEPLTKEVLADMSELEKHKDINLALYLKHLLELFLKSFNQDQSSSYSYNGDIFEP